MLVEELRQRARREGFDKLCAFTHAPGYFSQMGFSIVPHLWLPEKIFTDCVKCPLFRRCGQYAMVAAARARRRIGRPRRGDRRSATHDRARRSRRSKRSPAASRRRRASAPPASAPASRPSRASTSRCSSPTGPATAAAVFTTNRAQAAPVLVSREHLARSGGVARAIVVNSGCANACTGDDGPATSRATWRPRRRGSSAVPPSRCSSRRPASSASRSTSTRSARGLPAAMRALGADQGSLAARAIMTTDPFPKEAAARVDDRRPRRRRSAAWPRAPA